MKMKPVYSAYTPPAPKKKKHEQRTRFNTGRGRKASVQPVAETATTPPSNVPSLADVPQGSAAPSAKQTAAAKAVTMKPGKKEKIHVSARPPRGEHSQLRQPRLRTPALIMQAPRPSPVMLRQQQQKYRLVILPLNSLRLKQRKRVFRPRARQHKKNKGPKVDPFAPPPETTDELATQHQQSQALGLNGDTSKKKKKNPHKEGPKRRMSNEKKTDPQPSSTSPDTQTTAPPATSGQQ